MRQHRPLIYMKHAMLEAERSTCFRGNVGCVIVDRESKAIISTGYNGPPSGEEHCTGHACEGAGSGCRRAVHAEINAMKKSMIWPRSNLDLYVTVSPCGPCLTEIEVDIRIRRIFYCHEYRDVGHLWACKLEVYKVTPAGYITRFADNQKRLVDPESLYD